LAAVAVVVRKVKVKERVAADLDRLYVARKDISYDRWQAGPVKNHQAARRARGRCALYRHVTVGGGGTLKAAVVAGRTLLKEEEGG